MAIKVFCMKADYAEATSTHNTGNANFVHGLYSDQTPAQIDNGKCRTTIYGFPCVIFHQANENAALEFVGKYNFNADKRAENLFGFTNEYDVECLEFKNNTSGACLFNEQIGDDWAENFEFRYPEDKTDISRFKVMHDWVVSTKNNIDKFKSEFEQHFNLHKCLIYYVYTFFALMTDQRAKNMMMTYWAATGLWEPWFYDNDTCFGINNEGQLVFDYWHEDTDKVSGANVYNGQDSVLWNNFRVAFANEIKETYQSLRNSGKITYDKMFEAFITNESNKWSISLYNDDSEYKYISMLRTDNDATNLDQVRGNGEEHFKYFIRNRIKYCDSKWYASDYANDYISLRIYTPTDENNNPRTDLAVAANANITVTPFSDMYGGVRYKANGSLLQQRLGKNETYTFVAPNEVFNDTETAIYGASELSSLGDLSPLYLGSLNVSKAQKLIELIVGNATEGYDNPNLKFISVGTNALLKKIDIQNCSALTDPLALAYCPNIEEIYAKGSAITGVELADSGFLRIIQLPATLTNLTLKNQPYITQLSIDGYDAIKTLYIDNCPTVDFGALLQACKNLERIHITGITEEHFSFDSAEYLLSFIDIGGIDENGFNTEHPYLAGTAHITTLSGSEMAKLKEAYPYLTIDYDNLSTILTFMNDDGTKILEQKTILNGGDGTYTGSTPTRQETTEYKYTHDGWSMTKGGSTDTNALKNVDADRTVYPTFKSEKQKYKIRFLNGTTELQSEDVEYGKLPTYKGQTPVKTGVDDPTKYEFSGWTPTITTVSGKQDYVATFTFTGYIQDDWDVIAANENYKTDYGIGGIKQVTLTYTDGSEETIDYVLADYDHDDLADGSGKAAMTFIPANLLKDSKPMNASSKSYNGGNGYNAGGWGLSEMRTWCNNTIYAAFPAKLQAAIEEVTKISDGGLADPTLKETTDKVWLLSYEEVGFGANQYNVAGQGTAYSIFTNANSRKRSKLGNSAIFWWLRSSYTSGSSYFWSVGGNGNSNDRNANYSFGVAPCFCVGKSK